jgi:hypothetical protein
MPTFTTKENVHTHFTLIGAPHREEATCWCWNWAWSLPNKDIHTFQGMSSPCSWKTHTSWRQYKGKKREGETTFWNLLSMLEVSDNSQRCLNAISSMNSNMKVKGMRLHTWSRLLQTIFLVNVKKSFFFGELPNNVKRKVTH